jgi:hypothetical protein
MAFIIPTSVQAIEVEVPKYLSGYSEEEELRIKQGKKLLEDRDLTLEPVTLEEFKTIVAPWFRIHRTEQFILNPEKVKAVRIPKEPKVKIPKEAKPKKLTKAQVQSKFQSLVMKMAVGTEFTEEETEFFKLQTGG